MTIQNVGGYKYEYTIINDIPASKGCVGMTVDSLCWGKAVIVAYKNSKHISVLFLDSGNIEVVQKAALETGNVRDSVQGVFNLQLAKDKAIIAKCNEQIEKARKKAKMASRRIASRSLNRKERIARSISLYAKVMEKYNDVINKEESACS